VPGSDIGVAPAWDVAQLVRIVRQLVLDELHGRWVSFDDNRVSMTVPVTIKHENGIATSAE
jgi:hypothetical protein